MTLDERRIHIRLHPIAQNDRRLGILIGGVLIAGALIAVCYGYALGLPFYFDDLPVLTWLSGRGLAEVWTTSSENAYYRPLTFTIYAFGLLFPKGAQQVVLHAANLALHWTACAAGDAPGQALHAKALPGPSPACWPLSCTPSFPFSFAPCPG